MTFKPIERIGAGKAENSQQLAYFADKKDKKGQTQTGFVATVPMSPGYSPAINPSGVGGTFDSARLS